ncbi:MAG: DUF402 domain-containing protein [Pyrobaculum sp.]
MYRVRIRGVFATALTKLALGWGFKIVQPTSKILDRFGLEADFSPPDVTVKDHESRSGVVVIGNCEASEAFITKLVEYADPVVARSAVGLHAVFVGRAVGESSVEGPGGAVFKVPGRYVLTPGAVGVYTVVRPPVGPAVGVAVPEIIVEGSYVEVNTLGGVRFSRHIPEADRVRLRLLAETRLRLGGLGVRFKSSARYADGESIVKEAEALYGELMELAKGGEPGAVLRRGQCVSVALFDKFSKFRLDEARASAVPTVRGHHALRAQGLGRCLDLLDHLGGDVYEKAVEFLARGRVEILHIKPWGEVIKMAGEALGVFDGVLVVRRQLRPGGVLDGVGVRIERGFYALTCVPRDGYVVHSYYAADGRLVGTYVNANSPPEWGRRIIYIDLLADKAYVGGEEKLLDVEEFEKYSHMLPQRLRELRWPGEKVACTERGLRALSQSPSS